jgi:deoxyribodipyrimidine photo-lyase
MKYGDKIFFSGGAKGGRPNFDNKRMKIEKVVWTKDPGLLQRWKDGRTGLPLVDANMRELNATGVIQSNGS